MFVDGGAFDGDTINGFLQFTQGKFKYIYAFEPDTHNYNKLAICIYHKFEDLWKIPLFIKQLVPKYKLYIRNYTTYLDEIVLYAAI